MLHGDRCRTPLGRDEVSTGPDGTFEAKTVPAGRKYSVIAMADGYGKQDVLIDTSDLKDPRCEAGRFQLALADLSITGIVSTAGPLTWGEVLVYKEVRAAKNLALRGIAGILLAAGERHVRSGRAG